MKKIGLGFMLLGICLTSWVIQPWLLAKAQTQTTSQEESTFWSVFRKIFSRPEPSWSKNEAEATQTAGVRGVDQEGKLKEAYDYRAVKWMENYQVEEEKVKSFLQSRGLGPYKGQASKGGEE